MLEKVVELTDEQFSEYLKGLPVAHLGGAWFDEVDMDPFGERNRVQAVEDEIARRGLTVDQALDASHTDAEERARKDPEFKPWVVRGNPAAASAVKEKEPEALWQALRQASGSSRPAEG